MIEHIDLSTKNKRIIAVGNPPYQENDGGFGRSAKSIYDLFVKKLITTDHVSEFLIIIPARWFGAGKGLDDFRNLIRNSGKVRHLRYFKNSAEVFPTVDINGGISILHYDKSFSGKTTFADGKNQESLHLNEFDIIVDDPKGYALVRKVLSQWNGDFISSVAWSRKPFGLATDHFSKVKSLKKNDKNSIPCLSRNKSINYIDRNIITKNYDKIDLYKVSVPAVAGGSKGSRRSTIPVHQIFMLPKGTISTETYSVIDAFDSKKEAENLITYLKTDFVRYFLGLRKITQHLPRDRWDWVPYVDTKRPWTDADLFKLFKLTKEEQDHIKAKVKEWSC